MVVLLLERNGQYIEDMTQTVSSVLQNQTQEVNNIPHLPKRGGYHPQTVCLRLHQNARQSDPGHLSNLFYILSGHFDEKKSRGTP